MPASKEGVRVPLEKKPQEALERENLAIFRAYGSAPYLSIKHTSYFHAYEGLLSTYVGKPITFVEVGVYNGGSLFMWREFFGKQARTIGIDFNPKAKRWEDDGFEIWTGNQADPAFWREFLSAVGDIDVCLDDGGHSNLQQIQTVVSVTPHIKDGGLMIVEDTHASYMTQFGNPSRHSFMNFAFDVVDSINSRFPAVDSSTNSLNQYVSSVSFHESIVAFHIDRKNCFISQPTSNGGKSVDATDYRFHNSSGKGVAKLRESLAKKFEDAPEDSLLRKSGARIFAWILFLQSRVNDRLARKFFG